MGITQRYAASVNTLCACVSVVAILCAGNEQQDEAPLPCDSDALIVQQPGRYRYDCTAWPFAVITLRPNASTTAIWMEPAATSIIALRTTVTLGGIVLACAVVGANETCGFDIVLSGTTPLTTTYVPYNSLVTLLHDATGVDKVAAISIVVDTAAYFLHGSIANLTTTRRLANLTLRTTANAVVECMHGDCFEIRNVADDDVMPLTTTSPFVGRFHILLQGSITLQARELTSTTNFVLFRQRVNFLDVVLDNSTIVGKCQTDSALIHGLRGFYAPSIVFQNTTIDLNATHVLFTPQYLAPQVDVRCVVRRNSSLRLYRSVFVLATDAPIINASLELLDGSTIVLNDLGILVGACTFAFWEIFKSGGLILYRPHQVIDNLTIIVDNVTLNMTSTALMSLGGAEVRRSRVVVRNNSLVVVNNGSAFLTSMNLLTTSTADVVDARLVIGGSPGIFKQTSSILGLLTLIPFIGVNVVNASSVSILQSTVVINGSGSLHKVATTTAGFNITLGRGVTMRATDGAIVVESPTLQAFQVVLTAGATVYLSSGAVMFMASGVASDAVLRLSTSSVVTVAALSSMWLVGASLVSSSLVVETDSAVTLSGGVSIVMSVFASTSVDRFELIVRSGGSLVVDTTALSSLTYGAGWLHVGTCGGWNPMVAPRSFFVVVPEYVAGSIVPLTLLVTDPTIPPTSLPYAALGASALSVQGANVPVQVRRPADDGAGAWTQSTFNGKAHLRSSASCTPALVPVLKTHTTTIGLSPADTPQAAPLTASLNNMQAASVAGIVASAGLVAALQPFGALGAVGTLQSTFAAMRVVQLCYGTDVVNGSSTATRSEVLESIGAQAADNPLQIKVGSMDVEGLASAGGVLVGSVVLSLAFLCLMVLYRSGVHVVAQRRRQQRTVQRKKKHLLAKPDNEKYPLEPSLSDDPPQQHAIDGSGAVSFLSELIGYSVRHLPGALVPPCAVLLQPFVTASCGIVIGAATDSSRMFGIVAVVACLSAIAALGWRVLHRFPLVSSPERHNRRRDGAGAEDARRPCPRCVTVVLAFAWEQLFLANWVWKVPKRRAPPSAHLFSLQMHGAELQQEEKWHRAVVFEQRYLAVVEPYRRGFHWFFLVEMGATLLSGAAIGIGIGVIALGADGDDAGGCASVVNAVLVTLLVVAAALTGIILLFRPYVRHMDHVVQVALNAIGIGIFALELVGDETVAERLGLMQSLISVAVALLCLVSWKLPALLLALRQTLSGGGDEDIDPPIVPTTPPMPTTEEVPPSLSRARHGIRPPRRSSASPDVSVVGRRPMNAETRPKKAPPRVPPELEAIVSMICDARNHHD